jgi:hypothetical protein
MLKLLLVIVRSPRYFSPNGISYRLSQGATLLV